MPTYLVHGFRWQRRAIIIHIILQDLEDAAPDWIMAPATSISMLNSFYSMFDFLPPSNPPLPTYPAGPPPPPPTPPEYAAPEPRCSNNERINLKNTRSMSSLRSLGRKTRPPNLGSKVTTGHKASTSSSERPKTSSQASVTMPAPKVEKKPKFNDWSVIKLLEQYDPEDMRSVSQPYAYVADYMVEVKLGASLTEEMLNYEASQKAEEGILNLPSTPGTPATPATGSSGDLLSPRDARRRSRRLAWFEKLRDGLQKDADIGWFVVVCGDEERAAPSMELERSDIDSLEEKRAKTPRSAGLRGIFQKKRDVREEY